MARMARVVVPGIAHHVVQRGNRRQQTFFSDGDYLYYLDLLVKACGEGELSVWAYCLMPNHVHLIVVPESPTSLASVIGEVHRRYTRMVNFRENWRGYLWQGRFSSFPMDDRHVVTAARYILLNPLRARLVERLRDWPYSSLDAHLRGDDAFVYVKGLARYVKDWKSFLRTDATDEELKRLRAHARSGRPLGSGSFVKRVERLVGHALRVGRRGRPKRRRGGTERS
jgi:putative transposase